MWIMQVCFDRDVHVAVTSARFCRWGYARNIQQLNILSALDLLKYFLAVQVLAHA